MEHPIIQAPAMVTCTPALAAAVADRGLGSLGGGEKAPDAIRAEIRGRTNRSFNLNFLEFECCESDPAADPCRASMVPADVSLSRPIRTATPDEETSFHLYGQAAALATELTAGDLVEHLVRDTQRVIAGFSGR